ncbi:MAG: SLC13 family permease [Beijerinckiaceae bacterium]
MTTPQIMSVAIIVLLMAGFLWGRLRYDVIAGLALAASVAVGLVSPKDAFKGFSDDIVVIIASALVMSAAMARSGLLDDGLRWLTTRVHSVHGLLLALIIFVAGFSAIVKNIGTLAMTLPVAFQIAKKKNVPPSLFLMPMAFAALLGGMITLVGTSPNVIVARMREELTGQPFTMFDFTPVGIILTVVGVAFLAVGYRLIPADRKGSVGLDAAVEIKDYTTEAAVPDDSPWSGRTLGDLRGALEQDVKISAIVRSGKTPRAPLPDATLQAGDVLILRGEEAALERFIAQAKLVQEGEHRRMRLAEPAEDILSIEGVIGPYSSLIGVSAGDATLHRAHGINLVAISRAGARMTQRLRDIVMREGDVVVVRGPEGEMPETLRTLGILPLAERNIALGANRNGQIALAILVVTVMAVGFSLVPVAIGFSAAALAMVVFRAVSLREAYESVEWPIIVMLAAIIPVSDTLQKTGVTDLLSYGLSTLAMGMPAWGAVALILVAAMAVTPFLNNAATVLIMAPIASTFAKGLGYKPDAFLMAVAIGAACDFLTPIGHQCNTLVMGPGGYKFTDYARLGAPLSLLIILVGVPAILLFWPVK